MDPVYIIKSRIKALTFYFVIDYMYINYKCHLFINHVLFLGREVGYKTVR